jgi:CheY-like chemotaxis protein
MRPTLLVVDDESKCYGLLRNLLGDFNVVTLQDPERLDQVMNEVYPNVIICDVMMPDGWHELTRRIKSVKETAHIPIIVVSETRDGTTDGKPFLPVRKCISQNRLVRSIFVSLSVR